VKVSIHANTINQMVTADSAHVVNQQVQPIVQPVDAVTIDPPILPSFPPQSLQATADNSVGPIREKLFLSYSRKDQQWLGRIQTSLAPLAKNCTGSIWSDGEIKPTDRWRNEIDLALRSSKAALLLVSPSFFASEFIQTYELPYLVAAAYRQELRLTWALIQSCPYHHTPIDQFQAIHDIKKPLMTLTETELEEVLAAVCEHLMELLHQE
jgi:hypothetical protein